MGLFNWLNLENKEDNKTNIQERTKNQDVRIRDTLERLATNYRIARTDEERKEYDISAKKFLNLLIADKREHVKYLNYYNEKKEKK